MLNCRRDRDQTHEALSGSSGGADDLKRISHYIAVERESPRGAKRLREQLFDDFRRLARHPLLGQACPECGENLRIWPVGNYVVLYVPRDTGIDIVQVAHGRGTCRQSLERSRRHRNLVGPNCKLHAAVGARK